MLKRSMRQILTYLLKSEVGNIMAFKLTNEGDSVVNKTQLQRSAGKGDEEDKMAKEPTSLATTIRNSLDLADGVVSAREKAYLKARDESLQTSRLSSANEYPTVVKQDLEPKPAASIHHSDLNYETYHLTTNTSDVRTTIKSSTLIGIPLPLQTLDTWTETNHQIAKLPLTQAEIHSFIDSDQCAISSEGKMQTLLNLPPEVKVQVSRVIEEKTRWDDIGRMKEWLFHSSTALPPPLIREENPRFPWLRNKKKNLQQPHSYIIILSTPKPPVYAGLARRKLLNPPAKYTNLFSVDIQNPKRSSLTPIAGADEDLSTFKLTREEVENVVNDFLAGVSTLYEGIGVGERGKALRDLGEDDGVEEEDEDEEGREFDSDDSDR
jgi:hypothetical protein